MAKRFVLLRAPFSFIIHRANILLWAASTVLRSLQMPLVNLTDI